MEQNDTPAVAQPAKKKPAKKPAPVAKPAKSAAATPKSYEALKAQADKLQAEADELFAAERQEKIDAIKVAIDVYKLVPKDLFKSIRSGSSKPRGGGEARPAAYADANGNTWGGRGPRPKWIKEALEGGATLEQFAV